MSVSIPELDWESRKNIKEESPIGRDMAQRKGRTVGLLDLPGKIPLLIWRSWLYLKIHLTKNIEVGPNVRVYEGFKVILPYIEIGEGTRLHKNFYARGGHPVTIGKYCGFGEDVRIITGNHDMNVAAISMSFVTRYFKRGVKGKGKPVEIGNDVWVGDRSFILPGVKIGDGAIIGANAVVSKDVPPYGIALGIPAKVKKYRFGENVIKRLLEIKWWDWPKEKVSRNKEFFFTDLNKNAGVLNRIKK